MSRSLQMLAVNVVLAILVLLTGGAIFYRAQEQQVRQQVGLRLAAIARLKVDQIAAWRAERLEAGTKLMERPLLRQLITRCRQPHDGGAKHADGIPGLAAVRRV